MSLKKLNPISFYGLEIILRMMFGKTVTKKLSLILKILQILLRTLLLNKTLLFSPFKEIMIHGQLMLKVLLHLISIYPLTLSKINGRIG